MSRRLFLHIGAPKSGTSYLQDRIATNRALIQAQGLTYPETPSGSHFEAALDLIEESWAGQLDAARGSWDALVEQAATAPGDVLISHEILAAATSAQIERARRSFADWEVHVIYTARDLGRQLPAEWQEMVKHRSAMRFTRFMRKVQEAPPGESDFWFWRVQSLPDVLARWSAGLDPAHVHVVTIPRPGGPRGALWERFCSVVGIDPSAGYEDSATTNASLGIAETAALRQLNAVLRREGLSRDTYVTKVREQIVREVFARRESAAGEVPARWRPYVEEIATSWLEWLRGSRVDVVGALEDLTPVWPQGPGRHPDEPDTDAVAEAAIEALAALLVEWDRSGVTVARRPGRWWSFARWRRRA